MNGEAVTRPTAFIRRLFAAQSGLCFHCAEKMLLALAKNDRRAHGVTREHVFPRSTTGRALVNNIVLAHAGCNGDRGDRQPSCEEIAKAARIYKILKLEPFLSVEAFEAKFGPMGKARA